MKIYLILEKLFNENFKWTGYSSDQKYFLYRDLEYAEQVVRRKTIELFKDLVDNSEYDFLDYNNYQKKSNKLNNFINKHSVFSNIDEFSNEDILEETSKYDDLIIEYLEIINLSFYHIKEAEFDDILA